MHTDQRTVGGLPSQALLQSIPLFAGLTEAQLDHIAKMAIRRKVPRHSTIVHVGDCIDALYVIVSGGVKVLNRDADGREVILTLLGAGECFGEMGLIDGAPRSADVVTNENCELLVIAKTDFKRALAENVDLCLNIMKSLVLRLREANRKIESLALMDVYGRVARLLLEMSEEVDGLKVVRKKVSKQDIAKMIGASREMVSRVMKDLGLRGLIEETDGGVILREKIYDL